LVEGQFDLILAHQSGLPFTVALSGTALTDEHLSLLSRISKRLVIALDADEAGVRAGLRSSALAYQAGFDVKVPTFPDGKDPADLARENPELLKAAIRTSKTAVEFFLEVLRRDTRDERAYKKIVESQVLPLVALLHSRIEQEYFVRVIAQRLGVSEGAIQIELSKRPRLREQKEETPPPMAIPQETVTPFEKKVGMLLFYFTDDTEMHTRLTGLLGKERLEAVERELEAHAEELRFRFEHELGEHTTKERIAEDMLLDIERVVHKEQLKMKFI
jgi:DNA primase